MKSVLPSCLVVSLVLASCSRAANPAIGLDRFIWPGHDAPRGMPVWGHRNGLRIGIKPADGPAGLIRIYAPYLGQPFPRVVNFVSVEPSVKGHAGRGQSELEISRDRPGERGLTFWASNELNLEDRPKEPVPGVIGEAGQVQRVFIHTEPFANGAHPVIECVFRQEQPYDVEFITHAAPDSTPMASCVLSATMGNYGLLRQMHLKDDRVVSALDLWNNDALGRLGFLPWRTWTADQLDRTPDNRFLVRLSTDAADPSAVERDRNVAPHWRYVGKKAIHYWRAESDTAPIAATNGRRTYWMSDSPIPGGTAFENFELRLPFKPGQRLWFGVQPNDEPGRN